MLQKTWIFLSSTPADFNLVRSSNGHAEKRTEYGELLGNIAVIGSDRWNALALDHCLPQCRLPVSVSPDAIELITKKSKCQPQSYQIAHPPCMPWPGGARTLVTRHNGWLVGDMVSGDNREVQENPWEFFCRESSTFYCYCGIKRQYVKFCFAVL